MHYDSEENYEDNTSSDSTAWMTKENVKRQRVPNYKNTRLIQIENNRKVSNKTVDGESRHQTDV